MKPKVAIFYTHFPHYRQAVFDALLNDPDLDVEIFYDYQGINESIISGNNVDGHVCNRTYRFFKFYFECKSIISSISGKYDYYVFLGNPYVLSYWVALLYLKIVGKKTALWTHGWYQAEPSFKDSIRNMFYRLSSRLLLYNNRAKAIGIRHGFCPSSLTVVYNSLDYNLQKQIREKAISADNEDIGFGSEAGDYFLFVGRLIESAGVEFLIESILEFNSLHDSSTHLVIVGDGPAKDNLMNLSKETNTSIVFIGANYDEDSLSKLFMNAVAVISPNKIGLLAMHSLAYGCPVITQSDMNFQMPEAEAIVHGETGYLFRKGSKNSLISMMELSLSDSKDKAVRDQISQNCVAVIDQHYNAEMQVTAIKNCISLDL